MKHGDFINDVIKYEEGNMTNEEIISFFQYLVDSGIAWTLQGHYGRMAMHLIEEELITAPKGIFSIIERYFRDKDNKLCPPYK